MLLVVHLYFIEKTLHLIKSYNSIVRERLRELIRQTKHIFWICIKMIKFCGKRWSSDWEGAFWSEMIQFLQNWRIFDLNHKFWPERENSDHPNRNRFKRKKVKSKSPKVLLTPSFELRTCTWYKLRSWNSTRIAYCIIT